METEYPYQVFSPFGQIVLEATLDCRYPAEKEIRMLDAGFTIRIYGKKITKSDTRKRRTNNEQ